MLKIITAIIKIGYVWRRKAKTKVSPVECKVLKYQACLKLGRFRNKPKKKKSQCDYFIPKA
jgi:hypothetical protein